MTAQSTLHEIQFFNLFDFSLHRINAKELLAVSIWWYVCVCAICRMANRKQKQNMKCKGIQFQKQILFGNEKLIQCNFCNCFLVAPTSHRSAITRTTTIKQKNISTIRPRNPILTLVVRFFFPHLFSITSRLVLFSIFVLFSFFTPDCDRIDVVLFAVVVIVVIVYGILAEYVMALANVVVGAIDVCLYAQCQKYRFFVVVVAVVVKDNQMNWTIQFMLHFLFDCTRYSKAMPLLFDSLPFNSIWFRFHVHVAVMHDRTCYCVVGGFVTFCFRNGIIMYYFKDSERFVLHLMSVYVLTPFRTGPPPFSNGQGYWKHNFGIGTKSGLFEWEFHYF